MVSSYTWHQTSTSLTPTPQAGNASPSNFFTSGLQYILIPIGLIVIGVIIFVVVKHAKGKKQRVAQEAIELQKAQQIYYQTQIEQGQIIVL